MQKQDRPVAFFDSGLGGISVLRETVRLLPQENYLYYGDSLHAPYGVKSEAQIQALSLAAAEHLVSAGAKAIVVACNTATSAAIGLLRQVYPDIPVIGTEPALKPAVEKYPGGRILVMATPMTIRQEKFQALKRQFDDQAQIIGLPCEGLMEFVERGELRGSAVEAYLAEKLAPYLREPVDGIVLGCTHYPFLTGAIRRIVGPGPEIMDGSHGVAMQLARKLAEEGYTLIFYPHVEMQKYMPLFRAHAPSCKNIILADRTTHDVQDLLMRCSLLITDYSSVFFDVAYLHKPVIYYQFDDEEFRAYHYQEGYFDYKTLGFGPVCDTEDALLEQISQAFANHMQMSPLYQKRTDEFFPLRDDGNCKRTYEAIRRLK